MTNDIDRPGWQTEAIALAVDQYKARINRISNCSASQTSLEAALYALEQRLLTQARLTSIEVDDLLDRLYKAS